MPECDSCGEFVTEKYRRVFEIDGELNGCPDCGNGYGQHGDHGL